MPTRMTQEAQDQDNGHQVRVLRVLFDASDADSGFVEVAATVRVPAIESGEQTEAAARELAKRAIEKALSAFPL